MYEGVDYAPLTAPAIQELVCDFEAFAWTAAATQDRGRHPAIALCTYGERWDHAAAHLVSSCL